MKAPHIEDITSIADLQALVVAGFTDWARYGHVSVRRMDDLLIFNYTALAQYSERWNFFERVSRGLILHTQTGEIVARGFDKFYNYSQGGRFPSGHIVTVTEKVDGSVGMLYRYGGGYRIATRGSFESDQARWATAFLNAHFDLSALAPQWTLIFEIIYPDNRVIVDYGAREDLVLLAARDRFTGDYMAFFPDLYELAARYGFSLPKVYTFNHVFDILATTGALDANQEGYVVEFSDGSRYKFKGDAYRALQRMVSNLTFKNILRAVESGTVAALLGAIPDEFLGETRAQIAEIEATTARMKAEVERVFADAPLESRKVFALWVNAHHCQLAPLLFARYDGKPLEPIIYKETDWGDHGDPRPLDEG
jgi:RNA ligase